MANVFNIGRDKRIIIYSLDRYIFLRAAYIDGIERPVILAKDYLDGLSEAIYDGVIYYAYQNQERHIVVKNIMSLEADYVIEDENTLCPVLSSIDGELVLFYLKKNNLKCVLPLKAGQEIAVPRECENALVYDVFCSQGKTFLYCDSLYEIEKIGHYKQMSCDIQKLKEEIAGKDRIIESVKKQYNELMETASEYRNEALRWRNKFM